MTIVTILHSAALVARDQHVRDLCAEFSACGASVAIVMGPEPPMQDVPLLMSLVNMDPAKLVGHCSVFRPFLCDLKVRNLSNALKHAAAIQHIAAHHDLTRESWHVVVEDDSLIESVRELLSACDGAPADADMLFFGLPTPLPHGALRYDALVDVKLLPACDCYAVRMGTARFLSTAILPIRFKTEIHLSWLIASASIKTYLTSPNLSLDGSKVGTFVSSIESNSRLGFNPQFVALELELESNGGATGIESFMSRVTSMPFGGHPDVQVLLGRMLGRSGRYEESMSVFAAALSVYRAEGAVVGQDSGFMREYMDMFKHVQLKAVSSPSSRARTDEG